MSIHRQHGLPSEIKENASAAVRAMQDVENIELLSLETTMTLFRAKIILIIMYKIQLLRDHVSVADLEGNKIK